MTANNNLIDIDALMDAQFGAVGTLEREQFRQEAYDYLINNN